MNEIKAFFNKDLVRGKLVELVGNNYTAFITSVLQIVSKSESLKNAPPESIFYAACKAAALGLTVDENLGHAHIIPFKTKGKTVAQFQISCKGLMQLALRTNKIKRISATKVLESQLVSRDRLRGNSYDWSTSDGDVIGYVAFLELLSGFEAEIFMSVEEIKAHAKKYSESYRKGSGTWVSNFDEMSLKTVMKLLLSRFAPLEIRSGQLQEAIESDQAVIDGDKLNYIDNSKERDSKQLSKERLESTIESIKNGDCEKEQAIAMLESSFELTEEQKSELAGC